MGTNVYAAILAGGTGTRMGNVDKPKQFQVLGGKPIIIHTIEKFCASGKFDAVVVLSPIEWVRQTSDLIAKHCGDHAELIHVTAGGPRRNDTVKNAISFIQDNFDTDTDTVLVTHDAVRPFVSYRIIEENIASARETGACDTVVPATDTIVESLDGSSISGIPERKNLYQGQTPQSFNLAKLAELISGLTDEEEAILTDACKVFVLRGEPVALVEGDVSNMKITYPQDLRIARALMADAE